ncbi:MAG: hypothetical protein KDK28_04260, partial [Maritimibacter sp.]|nr:hypothetical protein [Maritimibacter sp.]
MLNAVKKFLGDETGNVTIESLVVIGGSVWMAGVIVTDISTATLAVTERLETRLEYRTIVEDILGGYGTQEDQANYSDPGDSGTGGDDSGTGGDDGS